VFPCVIFFPQISSTDKLKARVNHTTLFPCYLPLCMLFENFIYSVYIYELYPRKTYIWHIVLWVYTQYYVMFVLGLRVKKTCFYFFFFSRRKFYRVKKKFHINFILKLFFFSWWYCKCLFHNIRYILALYLGRVDLYLWYRKTRAKNNLQIVFYNIFA
jgi:hypothetical protein